MNNDIYAEWLVKKKPAPYVYLLKMLMIAFFVSSVLFMILVPSIGCLMFLVSSGLLYFFYKRLNVEYEYIFVTSELSIDRILGQVSRKRKAVIDLKGMEIMAPIDSSELRGFMSNPRIKKIDYSSQYSNTKKYGIYAAGSEGKFLYIIEPNEQMVQAIRTASPRKVIL